MSSGVYVILIKASIINSLDTVPDKYRKHFKKWLHGNFELDNICGEKFYIYLMRDDWHDYIDDIVESMMKLIYGEDFDNTSSVYGDAYDTDYTEFHSIIQPVSEYDKRNNPLKGYLFHKYVC